MNTYMPPRRSKIVVFGGDGFLGSHFVDSLVAQGHEVTVFDHFRSSKSKNLGHLMGRYRKMAGDLNDGKAVAAALKGQEVAAHLISFSTTLKGWQTPQLVVQEELVPSLQLFDLCAQQGVRKIIFTSSGGTCYGPQSGPISEETLPRPFNPHGITKLSIEHFLNYFSEKAGIASDCYRIGNLYGPRMPLGQPQGVIGAWIKRILAGEPLDIYGDENTIRDYVFAQDAAKLMLHSLHDLDASGTYNLGSGRGTSILELLDLFKAVSGCPVQCRMHPRRPSDNTSVILNSEKLLRNFPGFVLHDLASGLRECFAWAKSVRQPAPSAFPAGNIEITPAASPPE